MKQETALKLLKAGENVFLTGSAGAGKTYMLNQYINYLKARKVPVAITASTGIAATHMNGMTIHTWAGIGIKDALGEDELKRMKERKYLKEHLENAQVLIIDEISMLHAKQLNLVNKVLKFFKESEEPFGGIQVIVLAYLKCSWITQPAFKMNYVDLKIHKCGSRLLSVQLDLVGCFLSIVMYRLF
jgi:nucleoside-triphosphatase THEP1